jgi:hypothetical protein
MNKFHVLTASLILGLAAIFGVAAATKTAGIGVAAQSSSAKVSGATIAARQRKLDRTEMALRRALADRPPALPAVPKVSAAAPQAQHLVYQRPAPVIVTRSSSQTGHDDDHGEDEHEDDDD